MLSLYHTYGFLSIHKQQKTLIANFRIGYLINHLVDNTTKSSTFIEEIAIIKNELNRWFYILIPEYNSWKSDKY